MIRVTFGKNVKDKHHHKVIDFQEAFDFITTSKDLAKTVEHLRQIVSGHKIQLSDMARSLGLHFGQSMALASGLKSKKATGKLESKPERQFCTAYFEYKEIQNTVKVKLPWITMGIVSGKLEAKNLVEAAGAIYDLDYIANKASAKKIAQLSDFFFFDMDSPRNDGLKVGILFDKPIKDPAHFRRVYQHYAKQIAGILGHVPDPVPSSPISVMFLSSDPDASYNPNAIRHSTDIPMPEKKDYDKGEITDHDHELSVAAAEVLRGGFNDMKSWVKAGMAISTLGEKGRRLFHIISDNPRYDDTEEFINKQYDGWLNNPPAEINLGTLFYYAEMKGFEDHKTQITEIGMENPLKPVSDFLTDFIASLHHGQRDLLGLSTGIPALDLITSGLRHVTILAGPPKYGKTSLFLKIASHHAMEKNPVLFYSLEMTRLQLTGKLLSHYSQIKYTEIMLKAGAYLDPNRQDKEEIDFDKLFKNSEDYKNLQTGYEKLKEISPFLFIRDRTDEMPINFQTMEMEIRRLQNDTGKEVLVIVDHLQVMPIEANEYRDQIDKENRIINTITEIANKTGAATVLISQMSKEGIKSKNGLPSVKGSVDNIYLPHFIFLLYEDTKAQKDNNNPAAKCLILDVTSRDTRGGELKLTYYGWKMEFEVTREVF